jgi:pilus assembly protein CpaF
MQLETFLSHPEITDLVFNGGSCFVMKSGRWQPLESELSEGDVAKLAIELCDRGGRHIDMASPFADVSVDGFRVHAVLAAGVSSKPLISIRKHSASTFAVSPELQEIVRARQNFLVTGSTGAGKTTLLRSMFANIDERLITIEDVAELGFKKANFVSLVSRQPNIEGRGAIGLEQLFREALRMRPDRIILGEVRGAEFGLMLQALNTGHAGSAATLHANSLEAVPQRLIGLGLMSGFDPATTLALAKTAIDLVVHLSPGSTRIAKLSELVE